MDRSKLSNVIATTRLLQHFSRVNLNTIKSYIYQELGCENESQFVCKILQSIYKTLSDQSITNIKNKAMEIADCQKIQSSLNINQQSNMTVYKHVQKQYNDRLSKLHSDIIDYFGTFLNKKQSIEFGYLNRQLFIETQKQSYLLKRCKDNVFVLHRHKIDKLYLCKNDGFNYTFPTSLILSFGQNTCNTIDKISCFGNFFRRVNSLRCPNIFCLSCVPFELLFNKNSNYYHNDASRECIKTLRIQSQLYDDKRREEKHSLVAAICKDFDKYCNVDCDKNVRKIEKLEMEAEFGNDDQKNFMNLLNKQLLTRFGKMSKSVWLKHTALTIDTMDELKTIFHSNMTHLYCMAMSSIEINFKTVNDSSTVSMVNSRSGNKTIVVNDDSYSVGMLRNITMKSGERHLANNILTLNSLDKFKMRKNIEKFTVHWNQPHGPNVMNIDLTIGTSQEFFDKIFFQDSDKHPLLEEIKIMISDDCYLFGLAKFLSYFNQHHKELFVERKLYVPHFKKISIEYDNICQRYVNGIYGNTIQFNVNSIHPILTQKRTQTYPIDENVIEINKVEQGESNFGTIYQNVKYWLHGKQQRAFQTTSRNAVRGSVIVFTVE